MKKFISVFMSLTMLFTAFGGVTAKASTLQDMYNSYKYIIDINSPYYTDYDLYDIDKDNCAELILIFYDWESDYSYVSVYTYKNNQTYLCGYIYGDCMKYHSLCENRYGNGIGIGGIGGDYYQFDFYVLNGTELEATGNSYAFEGAYSNYYIFRGGEYLWDSNNKNIISEYTAKTYFPIRNVSSNSVYDLTYLNKYFNM